MKRFVSVVNRSIPFGKGLNALAHTAVGIGQLCPKNSLPTIKVLFADTETIRSFRQEVYRIVEEHPEKAVRSEFTNTMTVGDTELCLKTTKETPETQLTYYAVSICADETLLNSEDFQAVVAECYLLKNYKSYIAENKQGDFSFKERVTLPDYHTLSVQKIALILDRTLPFAELVNAAVVTSFEIGNAARLDQLRLLIYIDASNEKHPYISYHSFPILAAKKQEKLKKMALTVEDDACIISNVVRSQEGNVIGICMLGSEDDINAYTYQKFISFWTMDMPSDAFAE